MKTRPSPNRAGFSMLELLIACAVVGILASVVTPKMAHYRAQAIRSEGLQKISAIKGAMETFYVQYGVYATCWGSMGVQFSSSSTSYWGIGPLAQINNPGYTTGDTIARGKGAICPEGVTGALVADQRAFPLNRYHDSCRLLYFNPEVNYGFINYYSSTGVGAHLSAFFRKCTGSAMNADEERWGVSGDPSTGLSISHSVGLGGITSDE